MQIAQNGLFMNMVFFMASNEVGSSKVASLLEFRGLFTIEWE